MPFAPRPNFLSAILLAAGESTRMGSLKPLLPFVGRTLIQYQVDTLLHAGAGDLIVVTGHRADDVARVIAERPVTVVVNADYASGRVSSIRAGLARLDPRATAVLVLGVDQPRSGRFVARIVRAHWKGQTSITMPAYLGRGGHPVIFSARLLPELLAITEEGQGLREVVQRHQKDTQRVEVRSPIATLDLNTPDDYRRALEIFENEVLPGSR